MFTIEDDSHGDLLGEYNTFDEAMTQLRAWARIAWDQKPNRAPCTSWQTCGRSYEIVEYDCTATPWNRVRTTPILQVDARGVRWGGATQRRP